MIILILICSLKNTFFFNEYSDSSIDSSDDSSDDETDEDEG